MLDKFFWYARERETIRLKRLAGEPGPWTDDWVLDQFRFCNVFREDDKVTTWYRENIRVPFAARGPLDVIFATIAFRWFNRIDVGSILLQQGLLQEWDPKRAREVLYHVRPLTNPAYMVNSPYGMDKLEGLVKCINNVWTEGHLPRIRAATSLEEAHKVIMDVPHQGPFTAYEIVTDLRWATLSKAPDIMTWASPGPGAARGLDRIHGDPAGTRNYTALKQRQEMLRDMQDLLKASQDPANWPWTDRPWEMREVEHTLCEFDKWRRAHEGQGRPKQTYRRPK